MTVQHENPIQDSSNDERGDGEADFRRFLDALEAGDFDAMGLMLAPDAVWEHDHGDGRRSTFSGRDEVLAAIREVSKVPITAGDIEPEPDVSGFAAQFATFGSINGAIYMTPIKGGQLGRRPGSDAGKLSEMGGIVQDGQLKQVGTQVLYR